MEKITPEEVKWLLENARFDEPKANRINCKKCGHTWVSRKAKPPCRCPKCRTRGYAIAALPEELCETCGEAFIPRQISSKRWCPSCRHPAKQKDKNHQICVSELTMERLIRRRDFRGGETLGDVVARLLQREPSAELGWDYRMSHKSRAMYANNRVAVGLETHRRVKELCIENRIKTDQLIWRLLANEPKKPKGRKPSKQ